MTNSHHHLTSELRHLGRVEGRVAYDVRGTGPLVVCVTGMGDIRGTFRYLVPRLAEAGHRVAVLELRGHGDSDATFSSYDTSAAADDVVALVEELGGPALVVGHSMGAAAAFVAAARRPDLVSGVVGLGPFARDGHVNLVMRALFRVLMRPLWAKAAWKAYLPTLYAGRRPDDFAEHRDAMISAMSRPGYTKAFCATTRSSHLVAEQSLPSVTAPTLVVMGEQDPDFPDPAAEAAWIAEHVSGGSQVVMVAESGHYPHAQRPDIVVPAVIAFAHRAAPRA
jgi:pimeloyl-ACP methyl ester carboxylesterase